MLEQARRFTMVALTLAAMLALTLLATGVGAQLLLDDSLQGSTSGVRNGGTFADGGWKVTGSEDWIFWHLPHSVSNGVAEFYIKGVNPNQPEKNEHFHMYDYTYGNSDYVYNGGYRENPYKMFIRKSGTNDGNKANSCEVVYCIPTGDPENYFESDTPVLSWNSSVNYKFRVEWAPVGSTSRLKIYRDGVNILNQAINGNYTPIGHSVRIAKCRGMGEGAQPNAVYSYMKVWDMASYTPGAPTVNTPTGGSSLKNGTVFIKWSGDSHDRYQVRICTQNNPDAGIAWDSGQVMSWRDWAWTGSLSDYSSYYVFVKIGNSNGWSDWSATGYYFAVNGSASGSMNVQVLGNTYYDNNGPFLGLGFTYMASMWMCKNDRTNWRNEMAYMSARGFNYQRILSEVPGACSYCYWWGRAINASTYQCNHGTWASPWSDYDQQLKDCIDIAYDDYGIRTEITVFGGAGESFPTYSGRQNHCQRVLDNLPGREHKVILIEVANEAWQTGFPYAQGIADLRSLGQYLADRTTIPIALTAMCSSWQEFAPLVELYSGSAADITTEHFARDLNMPDGHWYPVKDCWRAVGMNGLCPISSNEPIGPGSSVNTEDHPIHLVSAASFAWIANVVSYVWHSRAGVRHDYPFSNYAAVGQMQYPKQILPPDVSSWIRNDGKESSSPFTAYCNGQPNRYWTDIGGATSGCHSNIGGRKGKEFVCYPQGILGGGLTLEAREQVTFRVYNPLTGEIVVDATTKNAGEQLYLSQGPEAYIIKGVYGTGLPAAKNLTSKVAGTITIDAGTSDWSLGDFATPIRGGQAGSGDTALVGYDDGNCYYGVYAGVLPTSASDHTAKVYSRNNSSYIYFLARCDDSDMRYNNPTSSNWLNDCVEIYIDPSHDHGSSSISDSTSDIQLVIDANNQKNVYMTTSGYATQVLNGVTSSVNRDGTGWWLEARISKTALDPDVELGATVGVDYNFRDNDNNNDAGLTTIYTWSDNSAGSVPSKVPNMWGDLFLEAQQDPYSGVINLPGTVQVENYDTGGQNVSFYDTTSGNQGGAYRSDNVDIESCSDTGGGYNIAYVAAGEWMEYSINVASSGDYSVKTRVATDGTGAKAFTIQMDGSDIVAKSFDYTGGWQSWTSIIAPSVYLSSGNHIMRFRCDTSDFNVNYIEFVSRGADAVSIDLGGSDVQDGMNHISIGDGDTVAHTIGGHYCRANATTSDNYMYFNVTEAYAYQGSKTDLYIAFDYYDLGTGNLTLHYDSTSNVWASVTGPTLTNSQTWKSYTFHVTDAYFGNRQNYGADFRIAGPGSGAEFEIDTVVVYQQADTTPPANVTNFTATPGDNQNALSWTNPSDTDFTGTMIRFKTGGYPTGVTDGTQIYNAAGTSYTHTGLTNGTAYYYKAYAHDGTPNYASGAQVSGTPVDTVAPGPVTGFTATAGDTQISLSWTNPTGDFTGTRIRFKTTGYPTSASDGTQIYDSSGTSYTHTGLTNGTTYYYSAYAHDEVPNYATAAQASTYPRVLISKINVKNGANMSITIDASSSDWYLTDFTTKTRGGQEEQGDYAIVGYDGGTCYRGSYVGVLPTSASDHTAKVYGRHDSTYLYFLVRCDDNDMQYSNGSSMNWANDCIEFYIDPSHDHGDTSISNSTSDVQLVIDANNQKNVYMTTSGYATQVLNGVTSSVNRDGTGWWLEARITKSALDSDIPNSGTFGLDFNFRDNDNNNDGALTTVYMWRESSTSGYPSKIPSHWGDANLETLTDTTPPNNVTAFTITAGDMQNSLSWTNPTNPDFSGVKIQFKTTGYPTSQTDGTQVYNSNGTSTTHTSLTNGATYYYKAFSYDTSNNYASGVTGSAVPADTTAPGNITGFTATSGDMQNSLSWTNPGDSDFAGVKIMFKTTGYPTGQADGTQCYVGTGTSYIHISLTNGTTYYYKAFTYDEVPNYSSGSQASAVPADTTAPDNVTNFTATAGDQQVSLAWANPGGDFAGVKIMFKTTGYPTSVTDGTVAYDGPGASTTRTNLTNGVTYYYKAYAYDEVPNYASGVQASATPADTTAPGNVTSFTATSGDTQNSLSWTNPYDSDFAGVKIMFKTSGYPTSSTDGTQCYNSNGTGATHTGLTNGTTYYYKAFSYDEVPNYSSGSQASAVPADVTPPSNVTNFTATAGDQQVSLAWSNPGGDFAGVKIMFKTTGYPTGPTDGTQCYNGSGTGHLHTGLTNGVTYYYRAMAYDEVPNYASGATALSTATDTTPPGNVTGFTVTPSNGQNSLSWTNPSDTDFAGVKIMFKTTGYPTGPTDGTQCCDSSGTSYAHTGLSNGTTYYYKAFAHDYVPNYASGVQGSGAPFSMLTINTKSAANMNLVIDASTSDWTLGDFTTKARGGMGENGDYAIIGYDGGTCYRGSYVGVLPTSASDHTAKVYTRHDQQFMFFLVRCDDNDMRYSYDSGSNWANDCVEFYIDPSHDHGDTSMSSSTSDIQLVIDCNNQKNVYMTTSGYAAQILNAVTTAVVRDGTGWWAEVKLVKSALDSDLPNSGTFGIDFNFRDNDNNNDAGLTTVYMWRESSTSGYPSKIPSHWGDASLASLSADTTAPAAVTNFTATAGAQQVSLSWTNPATADWAGTMIRYKTGSYPTGITDGTQCYSGMGMSYTHTGLTGTTYYYKAYAYDEVPNYASAAQASATPSSTVTLNNSAFDSDTDGWATGVWISGGYSAGTMAWTSGVGNGGGGIRCIGAGDSDNSDRCTREGGELQKTISTSGHSNIRVYYDLRVNALGQDRTGTGAGACAVDHNLIDEQLTVFYSTDGGSSWTEAEYLTRSALLGSYQTYGTRTIDLTGVSAVNNNANFRLRFRWQVNGTSDAADLDNIRVTSN